MSHHTATLQFTFDKTATAFDFACTVADRLYWLDDNYIQPFYSWAAPRLRKVSISGLYWGLVAIIDVTFWLVDTTLQFMARDAHAIALSAFAQTHVSFNTLFVVVNRLNVPSLKLSKPYLAKTITDLDTPAKFNTIDVQILQKAPKYV